MKKITIALMCTILATGAAMAQPAKTFTFGPKIGVDYTHFWGKDAHHGGQLNYQGGLFFEYVVADHFAIAPEVVFAAQGGKSENEMFGIKHSYTEHINYINVPVMLKYYITPSLSIDLGPQVGFNIYSKFTDELDDGTHKASTVTDVKESTKSVDVGVALGLTYNIAKDVFVQGRYTMGMTNVFKNGEVLYKAGEAKNGNAQIAIGYRF